MNTIKNKTSKSSSKISNENDTVVLAGQKACSAYFEKSGIRYGTKLTHTPFVVFNEDEGRVEVDIVEDVQELVKYPSQTKVMSQWRGKDRSNYFQFKVGDLKKHIKTNPPRKTEAI